MLLLKFQLQIPAMNKVVNVFGYHLHAWNAQAIIYDCIFSQSVHRNCDSLLWNTIRHTYLYILTKFFCLNSKHVAFMSFSLKFWLILCCESDLISRIHSLFNLSNIYGELLCYLHKFLPFLVLLHFDSKELHRRPLSDRKKRRVKNYWSRHFNGKTFNIMIGFA